MQSTDTIYTDLNVERAFCKQGMLNFTRAMFRNKTGNRFIVNKHHKLICDALDDVVAGKCTRLIINIAPRYGKTELVSKMFIAYGLALNPQSKFIHLSYSGELVMDNSRDIKEMVTSEYYTRLFPEVVVTDMGTKKWYTSRGGGLYVASTGGQVTGFGAGRVDEEDSSFAAGGNGSPFAGAIIIDDPIKPEDAIIDTMRERINQRFDSTIRTRVNSRKTPIIIVMQRLHENDLCGYVCSNEPDDWKVLSLPCLIANESGQLSSLWEFKHSVAELIKMQETNSYVFETQFQQKPKPREGLMYSEFRTYDTLPIGAYILKNYTDTADTGMDYLCSIDYAEYPDGTCFVIDVLYTSKPMEYTETAMARMLVKDDIRHVCIESNNGGRGFRRNVERNVRELGNRNIMFEDFTQTQNKLARIFTHSNEVMNMVFMPNGWRNLYPEYYNAMTSYRKEGRNAHDDAPDCTTGIVEHITPKAGTRFSRT